MKVTKYHLPPTALIPNSTFPLLHYQDIKTPTEPGDFHDICESHGWEVQWIYRYDDTQQSHYHSTAHECMAVLSGTATIRFGVGDTSTDLEESTYGNAREHGGVEIEVKAGDVLLIPAGVAHKTFRARPTAPFAQISPGDGHHIASSATEAKTALDNVQLSGFTMIGAYPLGAVWDSKTGGQKDHESFKEVWSVPKPAMDPVLGTSEDGLVGLWAESSVD